MEVTHDQYTFLTMHSFLLMNISCRHFYTSLQSVKSRERTEIKQCGAR